MKLLRAYENQKTDVMLLVFDLPNNCAASYKYSSDRPIMGYYTSSTCGDLYKSNYLYNPEYFKQMSKVK